MGNRRCRRSGDVKSRPCERLEHAGNDGRPAALRSARYSRWCEHVMLDVHRARGVYAWSYCREFEGRRHSDGDGQLLDRRVVGSDGKTARRSTGLPSMTALPRTTTAAVTTFAWRLAFSRMSTFAGRRFQAGGRHSCRQSLDFQCHGALEAGLPLDGNGKCPPRIRVRR